MLLKFSWLHLAFVLIIIVPRPLSGSEIEWRSMGLRGGINDNRNDEDFNQYEGFWRGQGHAPAHLENQFQFAGYYVARELGFYDDASGALCIY